MSPKKYVAREKTDRLSTAKLRRQAEAKLSKGGQKKIAFTDQVDALRLVHELQVHQIKLVLQNDELIQARTETESALLQYTGLYDLAPVGYFTLARDGAIRQVNLTGANLLGLERDKLIERWFGAFVFAQSRTTFDAFLEKVFGGQQNESCEVALQKAGTDLLWVHIDAACSDISQGQGKTCRAVVSDISERKQTEEALRKAHDELEKRIQERTAELEKSNKALQANIAEREARYRSILEDQTELICRYLPDGRLSYVNEAYARYYGEAALKLINTNFIPNIPEPDISMVIGKIAEITSQESVVVYEHRIIKPDGGIHWQRWTHRGIYNAAGYLIEHQAVGSDITESKQMESALATERRRLADILKGTNAGTWEWNVQTGETIFNERWAGIVGYILDELSPVSIETWINLTHPDDLKRSGELLEKHFKGELDYYECEVRMRHKNGHWVWVIDRGKVATWTEDGKPLFMSGTHQDITERKRVEEALRIAEADYRAIFERAPVGIFRSTVEGRFIKVNQAMTEMYGYRAPEEMINEIESIPAQIYADSSARTKFQNLLAKDGEVQSFIVQNRRRDGSVFWVSTNARAVKNETGEILYYEGFIENITARKQAEEQIQLLAKFPAEDPNPVLRVAREGTLLYINEAGLNLLPQWNLLVGKTVSPMLQEAVAQSMQNGRTQTLDLEHGERLYAFYVAPILPEGYANLYGHDITESSQAKALRDAEARYHVLFEQSPYGILLVDPAIGKTIEANEITSRQLGYTREEFAALKIADYEAAENLQEVAQRMQKIIIEGSDDFETLHRTKNGEIRNVHVWVKTLQLNDRLLFYTIFQDITERKRMEESNEKYSREITLLEERQRIASDLHDAVSQTLFSARLNAETLLRRTDRESDSYTHSLIDINRLVRSASAELRLLLFELRNNALLNVNLNTLLANLIDSGMARTNANIVFQCYVDELVLPAQVKLAFYRIAQEAINNAVKHGKPANINCILHDDEHMLEMIVQDDGIGFSMDKVSDDHFGLQIMHERADQAGVELTIATQPGSGTSVTVNWKKVQL